MKIALGADHGGFHAKETIRTYLQNNGYEVLDLGTYSNESVDYPEFGIKVGEAVAKQEADYGIVVCSSGVGISIAANKVKGIRCSLVWNAEIAKMSKAHNNANVLAVPGLYVEEATILEIVKVWLSTPFEGGRHERRVNIISNYDERR